MNFADLAIFRLHSQQSMGHDPHDEAVRDLQVLGPGSSEVGMLFGGFQRSPKGVRFLDPKPTSKDQATIIDNWLQGGTREGIRPKRTDKYDPSYFCNSELLWWLHAPFIRVDISKIDFSTPRRSHFITNQRDLAWARIEIQKYLAQGVLSPSSFPNPLIHPWFVVKKRGRRRLVVDFDRLNAAILSPTSASYEDLSTVPPLVCRRRRWLTSLDLKSAFHHVPLAPATQALACIAFQGSILSFRVMTFGLSVAPRIWCAILAAALAPLRAVVNLSFYMDDILIASPSPNRCNNTLPLSEIFGKSPKSSKGAIAAAVLRHSRSRMA